ncbi:uncharacterized protein PRCAT00000488001 [Priceomyces carsonii]|uniref:uncharacterized protein n=1 Tax=Priceomyces carsonii TaxID=28549 RepID=UPI002EDAC42A|nr:unnamed protein product [Priceomyces carsonii]
MSKENRHTDERISHILSLLRARKSMLSTTSDPEGGYEDIENGNMIDRDVLLNKVKFMLTSKPIAENSTEWNSSKSQIETESRIVAIYKNLLDVRRSHQDDGKLFVKKHAQYVKRCLEMPLPHYRLLDANHGWMLYWLINSDKILKEPITHEIKILVTDKVRRLVINNGLGGIAGGANQIGHLASAYASVLALVLVEDFVTLSQIRHNIYEWLMSLKNYDGSFSMHNDGERDTRSTYCALVIASLLDILSDELVQNTLEWIQKCQTFEGGIAGSPGTEAHGGYTFCGFASYFLLLGRYDDIQESLKNTLDVDSLLRYVSMRQYQIEGGFSGRTNKLVDACYSFWIGAVFPMLESVIRKNILFDRECLKIYLLECAQLQDGGLRDKPGTSVDFYHTNYSLCGLSLCEHHYELKGSTDKKIDHYAYSFRSKEKDLDTETQAIHPVFGIPINAVENCRIYFQNHLH